MSDSRVSVHYSGCVLVPMYVCILSSFLSSLKPSLLLSYCSLFAFSVLIPCLYSRFCRLSRPSFTVFTRSLHFVISFCPLPLGTFALLSARICVLLGSWPCFYAPPSFGTIYTLVAAACSWRHISIHCISCLYSSMGC